MRAILAAVFVGLAGLAAAVPAFGDEPPAADNVTPPPAPVAAKSDPAAASAQAAAKDEIRLPAGFKPKKRGKFTVYCRKDTVMGTRFPTETCYDERGIRAYILDQQENQKQVDQMRRICGSQEACGGGG